MRVGARKLALVAAVLAFVAVGAAACGASEGKSEDSECRRLRVRPRMTAPTFSANAVVSRKFERVSLSDYAGGCRARAWRARRAR